MKAEPSAEVTIARGIDRRAGNVGGEIRVERIDRQPRHPPAKVRFLVTPYKKRSGGDIPAAQLTKVAPAPGDVQNAAMVYGRLCGQEAGARLARN